MSNSRPAGQTRQIISNVYQSWPAAAAGMSYALLIQQVPQCTATTLVAYVNLGLQAQALAPLSAASSPEVKV